MRFFVADLHLGENDLHLFPRPFEDAHDFFLHLQERWNEAVGEDDIVYVIGDVVVKPDWLHELDQLNGVKHLIKGNYDDLPDDVYLKYFKTVSDSLELTLRHGDTTLDVRLDHYPARAEPDRFAICGHVHGAWRVQKNMLNVGVDVHFFTPITEEQIMFFYYKICEIHDEDVWVGTHHANLKHNSRGRQGTYWESQFAGQLKQ